MRQIKLSFEGGDGVRVVWDEDTSGLPALAQRAATHAVTAEGSDKIVRGRGTDLMKSILSQGAYDFVSVQHLLNFASVKITTDIQSSTPEDTADENKLRDFQMILHDISNGRAQTILFVRNIDENSTRIPTNL